MEAVRIPVPYFIFEDREPFIRCIEELDKAIGWAEKYGLQILIDLHTAPMSQNGFDNGGICGVCKWSQSPEEVEFVLSVLERLAKRYGTRKGLWGIEILNEPITENTWKLFDVPNRYPAVDAELAEGSGPITLEFLRKFYLEAYDRIRRFMPEEKYVVLHDGFELMSWKDFMQEEKYAGVVLDTHQYLMMAETQGCEQTVKTEFLNTRIPVDEKPLFLRLNIQGRRSWFEWSYDNKHYEAIGKVFDTTRFSDEYCKYGEFTGTMVGITCADRVKHTHYADFDFFEYIADETKPVE